MQPYRRIDPAVHRAEQRLAIVTAAATRDENTTVADVARDHDCPPAQVYSLRRRVIEALMPRQPGPAPRSGPVAVTIPTTTETASPHGAVVRAIDPRTLVCQLTARHVSVRGIHEVLAMLGLPGASCDAIVELLGKLGRAARRLLDRAADQLRAKLRCLAGDDIFFHRVAVKVLMEPESGAVLDVQRWPWRKAQEWKLWIEAWPALRLFVSDCGTDLVGATRELQMPHQADKFHERQWWTRYVFSPLSRRERKLAKALAKMRQRAANPATRGPRPTEAEIAQVERERATIEEEFYLAVAAEERLLPLFDPLTPRGRLWTQEEVDHTLSSVVEWLVELSMTLGLRITDHLYRYRAMWCAHRVLWDALDVQLAPGAAWTRAQVMDAILDRFAARREQNQAEDWHVGRAAQCRADALGVALAAACTKAGQDARPFAPVFGSSSNSFMRPSS